jgi:organic radical activating enzyme
MLWSTCSNISIITNFGCDHNCWYCIWKNHKLKNYYNFDYYKLEDFLVTNKDKGKVSISGGGDPLYNYFENLNFWIWLINTCKNYNIKIDIHTRTQLTKQNFWRKHVHRCVFSLDQITSDNIEYLTYLSHLTKLRITHTVTHQTTNNFVDNLLELQNKLNCQLTLKELYGYNDKGVYNQLKMLYPNIYYLDHGDYNIYYMPDNSITDKFVVE